MADQKIPRSDSDGTCTNSDSGSDGDIAIIGIALKYPGDVVSAETLWEMLLEARCASTEFPPQKLNINGFYRRDKTMYDSLPLRGAHFLGDQVDCFDAPFFSITSAEAACMDPQHRGMLEVCFHALENAGITLEECSASRTSVHTASFSNDYEKVLMHDPLIKHQYAASGVARSMLANRLSWFFNLKGPSMNIDTACSSSLTGLHLACEDLRHRRTDMGLVGGCNLILHPDMMTMLSDMSFLSPDSRSWSFDERANGYSRGEGFGMLVLKRLSDAIHDGNTIRAVIRASGLNQDGRTPGITVPNGESHRRLIEETYSRAGIDMGPTRFFEAHSTGTAVGDPTESNAVGEVFSRVRSAEDPLYLGSIKANIGHTEGGSGIASVIKTILVLEKGIIPPIAGLTKLNPRINAEYRHLRFPQQPVIWPSGVLRRACVNSFGFGGSNAVVILDDHRIDTHRRAHIQNSIGTDKEPSLVTTDLVNGTGFTHEVSKIVSNLSRESSCAAKSSFKTLVLSSFDENGLTRSRQNLKAHLEKNLDHYDNDNDDEAVDNMIFTYVVKRTHFVWRQAVTFSSTADLLTRLEDPVPTARASNERCLAFVFTGQGAQYPRMGRALLHFETYRKSLELSRRILYDFGADWSLLDKIAEETDPDDVSQPKYSQPLCTALQIGLVDLMRSWNISASAVVGHSSGEIAAAYCAGFISQKSAIGIAYHRGCVATLLTSATPSLSMAALGIGEQEAKECISALKTVFGSVEVDIAAINSTKNVTISGNETQINSIISSLQFEGKFARKLKVNNAYHSRFMQPAAEIYTSLMDWLGEDTSVSSGGITMVSSVTGSVVTASEVNKATYWTKNMLQPVLFLDAVKQLCSKSGNKRALGMKRSRLPRITDIIEVGPHSALRGPINECLMALRKQDGVQYHPSLSREMMDSKSLINTAATLHCRGFEIDLLAVNVLDQQVLRMDTDLPQYPFNHSKRYWLESRISKNYRQRVTPRHDFLGIQHPDWNPLQPQWRNMIDLEQHPWVEDHCIDGSYIVPAGGMIVMALEAVAQLFSVERIGGVSLENVKFLDVVRLRDRQDTVETRFSLTSPDGKHPALGKWLEFHLHAFKDEIWTEACRGYIKAESHLDDDEEESQFTYTHQDCWSSDPSPMTWTKHDSEEIYTSIRKRFNAEYGPSFQSLSDVETAPDGFVRASIDPQKWAQKFDAGKTSPHVVHPATLDACFQLVYPSANFFSDNSVTLVPTFVKRMWIDTAAMQDGPEVMLRAESHSVPRGLRGALTNAAVSSNDNMKNIIRIDAYESTVVASSELQKVGDHADRHIYANMQWLPDLDLLAHDRLKTLTTNKLSTDRVKLVDHVRLLNIVLAYFMEQVLTRLSEENFLIDEGDYRKNLINWMKYQLNQRKYARQDILWERVREDDHFRSDAIENVRAYDAEGSFTVKVAENLYDIIEGYTDPLELIFTNNLAENYYQESMTLAASVPSFDNYMQLLRHKNPNMSILEVGSGTGSLTIMCLNALRTEGRANFSRYDFTDISPSFFSQAQEKFSAETPQMNFRLLDAEDDFLRQGFEECSYDLVLAGNVLHALNDLESALRNIRRMLKPGGKLVLFEITNLDTMRIALFGVLKDWWSSVKNEEKHTPLLTCDDWEKLLIRAGFRGVDLHLPDYDEPELQQLSIIVSTVGDLPLSTDPKLSCMLLTGNETASQQSFAETLETHFLKSGKDCQSAELRALDISTNLKQDIVIVMAEIDKPLLSQMSETELHALQLLFRSARRVLWVTRDSETPQRPAFGLVQGLSRVVRNEENNLMLVTLSLEPRLNERTFTDCQLVYDIVQRMTVNDGREIEYEYRQRDGLVETNRIIHEPNINKTLLERSQTQQTVNQSLANAPRLELLVRPHGHPDGCVFSEVTDHVEALKEDEIEVDICAFGVSHADVRMASGQLNESQIGMACSGTVTQAGHSSGFVPGEQVCVLDSSCFQTRIRCSSASAVKVPKGVDRMLAASLPLSVMLAHHAIHELSKLEVGDSILIHHAASIVGQMAIQFAQSLGVDLFVSSSTRSHREMLSQTYSIEPSHVFSSHSDEFCEQVMRLTNGRGVDVTLNCIPSIEGLTTGTLRCLADCGHFIEIGPHSNDESSRLSLSLRSMRDISFSVVNPVKLMSKKRSRWSKVMSDTFAKITQNQLRIPVDVEIFPMSEISSAFHSDRCDLEVGESIITLDGAASATMILTTKPQYNLDHNATFVIAGGLGGLGQRIARWFVDRGARNLVLLSRSGVKSSPAQRLVAELSNEGVNVSTPCCDISDADQLRACLDNLQETMPPVKGCVQATMVLADRIFQNMSHQDWTTSIRPKVQGSWNLHELLPKDLDFFVLMSSVAGIMGSTGQANYAAGNTYEDALAHYRHSLGLKAAVIDLGLMIDAGAVAETAFLSERVSTVPFFMPLYEREMLALLEYHCDPTRVYGTPSALQSIVGIELPSNMLHRGFKIPPWFDHPMYRHFKQAGQARHKDDMPSTDSAKLPSLRVTLQASETLGQAAFEIAQWLCQKVAGYFGMAADDVLPSRPLISYGIDSLVVITMRNEFEREAGAQMTTFELMSNVSITEIGLQAAKKSRFVSGELETIV